MHVFFYFVVEKLDNCRNDWEKVSDAFDEKVAAMVDDGGEELEGELEKWKDEHEKQEVHRLVIVRKVSSDRRIVGTRSDNDQSGI